jgi:hypothetical protein
MYIYSTHFCNFERFFKKFDARSLPPSVACNEEKAARDTRTNLPSGLRGSIRKTYNSAGTANDINSGPERFQFDKVGGDGLARGQRTHRIPTAGNSAERSASR